MGKISTNLNYGKSSEDFFKILLQQTKKIDFTDDKTPKYSPVQNVFSSSCFMKQKC